MNLNIFNIDINDNNEIKKFITEVKYFYKKKGLRNSFKINNLPKDNLILFVLKDERDWYSYSLFIKDDIRLDYYFLSIIMKKYLKNI